MSGPNMLRKVWNDYQDGTSLQFNNQKLVGSIGSGWFITRVRAQVILVWEASISDDPSSTSPTGWPPANLNSLLCGIQIGPSGYGGYALNEPDAGGSEWLFYENMPVDQSSNLVLQNGAFSAWYGASGWDVERRFGAKPLSAGIDIYVNYGYDQSSNLAANSEFSSMGLVEIWYG